MQAKSVNSFSLVTETSEEVALDATLRKFWEQEEIPTIHIAKEDNFCENFFTKPTTRQADGRYIVRLPFKDTYSNEGFLGSSRFLALDQYTRMQSTLAEDKELETEYNKVLQVYKDLNHMEKIPPFEKIKGGEHNSFYLPHHSVLRPDSKTTKLRVVVNASQKSRSGFSPNDILYAGPTLQTDLTKVILNWRK